MRAGEILERLEVVKGNGTTFIAKCPAHEDNIASLSLRLVENDRLLVYCHAGCAYQDIVNAMGLQSKDFMGNGDDWRSDEIVATYDYRDADGKLAYQSVRKQPKGFFQRHMQNGEWVYSMKEVERRYLYNLPAVLSCGDRRVVVVEGEKDADLLISKDIIATTNVGGAGKWLDCYSETLRGKRVLIIPDNDKAGRHHAYHVAGSCLNHGALMVGIAQLPVPEKGDVSDYLRVHSVHELKQLLLGTPCYGKVET